MKPQVKVTGMLIASLVSVSAYAADSDISKPTTRIDFNKMIDQNNNVKTDLQKSVAGQEDQLDTEVANDQRKAMDFIDMEMKHKSDPSKVVDRRFNSVGEVRVETALTQDAQQEAQGGS